MGFELKDIYKYEMDQRERVNMKKAYFQEYRSGKRTVTICHALVKDLKVVSGNFWTWRRERWFYT